MRPAAINQQLFSAAVHSMISDKLSALRRNSAEKFSQSGFPTQKNEQWKYTNLQAATELSNSWLQNFDPQTYGNNVDARYDSRIAMVVDAIDAHWITLRNGIVDSASVDSLASLEQNGVMFSRLSTEDDTAGIRTDEPLSAFNAALLRDGLHIRATAGSEIDKPLALLLIDDGTESVTQSRVILDCADGAWLKVIEYACSADATQFANMVTQVSLGSGAHLDYVRIQERHDTNIGINRLTAALHDDAIFNHCAIDFGNALGRNDVVVEIKGSGATANMHGLYLAAKDQHIDNHLNVIHSIGPASSLQNYRGILNDRSRCVFNGKVEVMKGADGTDAQQSNHNLLLSDRAEIDTKPELEIYADDVKCSHGATVGQLDEDAIFYLRSRGLSTREAKHVLTRAFASVMLGAVCIDECREYLAGAIERRLDTLLADEKP
jgi:Fe-S cluster assembly protein SufD